MVKANVGLYRALVGGCLRVHLTQIGSLSTRHSPKAMPKCPGSNPCQLEGRIPGSFRLGTPSLLQQTLSREGHCCQSVSWPEGQTQHGLKGKLSTACLSCCRPEELCLTFSCAHGLGPEANLIPDGNQVEVDSSNWRDYHKHMVAFKLHKSIQREVEAVKKGLQHFVDERTMRLLHR